MATQNQIGRELTILRDGYPSLFVQDENQWQDRVTAYHRKLGRFDLDLVKAACDVWSGDRFPTSGQLVTSCRSIEKRWVAEAQQKNQEAARKKRDAETAASIMAKRDAVIPNDVESQERWINEPADPFERLARRWECESKNLNLDPDRMTPKDVSDRRFAEFWGMWNETNPELKRSRDKEPRTPHELERCGLCRIPRVSHERLSNGCAGQFSLDETSNNHDPNWNV